MEIALQQIPTKENYATTCKPKFVDTHLSCNGLQATTISTISELADEVPCGVNGIQVTA